MTKVCFLDYDGPMIPMRAAYLQHQTHPFSRFDPCAVAMLLRLVGFSGAKIVVSSTWGLQGYETNCSILGQNGIDPALLHRDWITPRKMSSHRASEIRWWLDDHPEVTHYVAIDDESLDFEYLPCAVQCDSNEGFSFRNYLECCVYLDAYEHPTLNSRDKYLEQIALYKRREIWRTKRYNEPGAHLAHEAADLVFPCAEGNNDAN